MKILVGVARIFVGVLFIISGLIKLNDPVGFSFKLGDYFAPEVLNLEFLVPFALLIAVAVVIFEVLLGVMLIVGYAKKFTLWSLLVLIVGFTFLTFYSAYFNKVTDCGCFGDALKLTPWESFTKDVVLLVLILFLFYGQKYIQPFFTKFSRSFIVFISFILCLWLGYHVLMHLPIVDFRAYAIGKNIKEGMETPPDAPKPIYEYTWVYNVNGEEKVVVNLGEDPGIEGELLSATTEVIQEAYEPPVHDFSIERDGNDFTEDFLSTENLIVVMAYNLDNAENDGFIPLKIATDKALKLGYKVIGMSASSTEETEKLTEKYHLNFDFYFCDMTTLKTIVRSNPGIIELQKGTITQKLHFNDADKLQLNEQEGAIPSMDFELKKRLDSIAVLDQKYRKMMQDGTENIDSLWRMQEVIDATNLKFVADYFDAKGYPGKSIVGEPTNTAAWYVLQHNPDQIEKYLPMIKKAGKEGEIPFRLVAMMEDRYLMGQDKPQIYGTQGSTINGDEFIWPIEDPENVNKRRVEAGYDQTIEEYAKLLFGDDFEYKVLTIDQVKQ
ncbi:hypothetical protein ULMA_17480 [Patiriisocius marinus]|uniref:Methylamine utilisation protein MauE domain-containing protein n=1 Tax=Patiriisocius marinus TaxID=1397112 RepID=A0A5J4J0X5_9FLAO|nr:BT_3928 family protein [Patiriisocius marinus]GER59640.1 hypothetical protein ULMA_17480 [Patiriisocius marinus]